MLNLADRLQAIEQALAARSPDVATIHSQNPWARAADARSRSDEACDLGQRHTRLVVN